LWNCGARSYLKRGDFGKPVFCVPGLGRLDEGAFVVAGALKREGINARVADATTAIEDD